MGYYLVNCPNLVGERNFKPELVEGFENLRVYVCKSYARFKDFRPLLLGGKKDIGAFIYTTSCGIQIPGAALHFQKGKVQVGVEVDIMVARYLCTHLRPTHLMKDGDITLIPFSEESFKSVVGIQDLCRGACVNSSYVSN